MPNENSAELLQNNDSVPLSHPTKNFASLAKNVFRPVKYFIRTQFAWMCIALAFVFTAFQFAGTIMGIAHALIVFAWLIAIFGVWLSRLWAKSRKHGIITMIAATAVLIVVDFRMVYLVERQEIENDPQVKVYVEKGKGEIYIKIRVVAYTTTLALDYPVFGKIINVHDYTSVTPTGKPPPLAVRLEKALPFQR